MTEIPDNWSPDWFLCWSEPWPDTLKCHGNQYCEVRVSVMLDIWDKAKLRHGRTDRQMLDDFMVVHWAELHEKSISERLSK